MPFMTIGPDHAREAARRPAQTPAQAAMAPEPLAPFPLSASGTLVVDHAEDRATPVVGLVAPAELSGHHLKQRDAAGGKDPVTLKDHPYFGALTESRLGGLRTHAIRLGAFVRSLAARNGPAREVPDRPVRGADISPDPLERAAADVKRALAKAMKISAEAAGPAH
jgi:hypothetical protein